MYSVHVSGVTSSVYHRVNPWQDPTNCHVSRHVKYIPKSIAASRKFVTRLLSPTRNWWCNGMESDLGRFAFWFMCSGLVAREVREHDRNGHVHFLNLKFYYSEFFRRHRKYRVTFLQLITESVSDYVLKIMSKTTLILMKMSWSAMSTDMRSRRYYLRRSTHSYLTLNEVRQSKTTKDKDNNKDATRQYTAESLEKLNMNILKHFSTNWRNRRLTNFIRIDVTRVTPVFQTRKSSGSSKERHTRSSEQKHHEASSTFLGETLILSRSSVDYVKKRTAWSDTIIIASAVNIMSRRLRWQGAHSNCMW